MKNCTGVRRCLICCRVSKENSWTNSEKPVSKASILQDFLDCFQINVLDNQVIDPSNSFQFCPTCEQCIAEWSSIQTQMTQLTRRAAQLKDTLSALLLSTPVIHAQNNDDHGIINNRILHSQEDQLPLLLQQTVDGIRDELQKRYSVHVMLEKILLPLQLNLDALPANLPVSYDDVDEPSDHGEVVADDFEVKYFPKEDKMDDEVKPENFFETKIKREEQTTRDKSNSQDSVDSKEINVKAARRKTNAGPSKPNHHDTEPDAVLDKPEAVPFVLDGKRECPHCQKRYQNKSFLKHVRSCLRILAKAKKKCTYRCCLCKEPYETRNAKNACEDSHLVLCSCGQKLKYGSKRRGTHKEHKGYKKC